MSYYDDYVDDSVQVDVYATTSSAAGRCGYLNYPCAGGLPINWAIVTIIIAGVIALIAWKSGRL
jgi:hypothetical protein